MIRTPSFDTLADGFLIIEGEIEFEPWRGCTALCEATKRCVSCERMIPPIGRSVPMESYGSYCSDACSAWDFDAYRTRHLWPGEFATLDRIPPPELTAALGKKCETCDANNFVASSTAELEGRVAYVAVFAGDLTAQAGGVEGEPDDYEDGWHIWITAYSEDGEPARVTQLHVDGHRIVARAPDWAPEPCGACRGSGIEPIEVSGPCEHPKGLIPGTNHCERCRSTDGTVTRKVIPARTDALAPIVHIEDEQAESDASYHGDALVTVNPVTGYPRFWPAWDGAQEYEDGWDIDLGANTESLIGRAWVLRCTEAGR